MNKNKIYIYVYIVSIILVFILKNKYTVILTPTFLMLFLFYLYRKEIKCFNYNSLFNDPEILEFTYKAFIYALAGQYVLNLGLSFIFKSQPHSMSQGLMTVIPTTGMYAFLDGFTEEFIFRKLFFGWLNTKLNFWIAALISSSMFAVGHGLSIGFFGYIFVGMVFCWVYKKSGKLETVIMAHMYLNYLAVVSQSIHMNINI